jgi:hypothetical protein
MKWLLECRRCGSDVPATRGDQRHYHAGTLAALQAKKNYPDLDTEKSKQKQSTQNISIPGRSARWTGTKKAEENLKQAVPLAVKTETAKAWPESFQSRSRIDPPNGRGPGHGRSGLQAGTLQHRTIQSLKAENHKAFPRAPPSEAGTNADWWRPSSSSSSVVSYPMTAVGGQRAVRLD